MDMFHIIFQFFSFEMFELYTFDIFVIVFLDLNTFISFTYMHVLNIILIVHVK
jgi:hypothetical protein